MLLSLQQAMLRADQWSDKEISAEALASQQPFCLDTMNFSQWLQFVFIPRMQAIIDARQVLPSLTKGQGLEPMACEFYKNTVAEKNIIAMIRQLDELLQD
jgi:dTDP-4-dehydrorhamnose 3,5-epimerase